MSNKITKNEIELFTIEFLEKQGFSYVYTLNIAPDSETSIIESFDNPVVSKMETTCRRFLQVKRKS